MDLNHDGDLLDEGEGLARWPPTVPPAPRTPDCTSTGSTPTSPRNVQHLASGVDRTIMITPPYPSPKPRHDARGSRSAGRCSVAARPDAVPRPARAAGRAINTGANMSTISPAACASRPGADPRLSAHALPGRQCLPADPARRQRRQIQSHRPRRPLSGQPLGIALRPPGAGGHIWTSNAGTGTTTTYIGDVLSPVGGAPRSRSTRTGSR